MKYILAFILSISLLFGICFAADKLELKDQKDKESYSLGYQFGQGIKTQGLDINLEAYTSGIKDALSGTNPQLSQEEIQKTISGIQKRVMAAREKGLKEISAENLSESKIFLEENKKKEGIKTLPSGLQYGFRNQPPLNHLRAPAGSQIAIVIEFDAGCDGIGIKRSRQRLDSNRELYRTSRL